LRVNRMLNRLLRVYVLLRAALANQVHMLTIRHAD